MAIGWAIKRRMHYTHNDKVPTIQFLCGIGMRTKLIDGVSSIIFPRCSHTWQYSARKSNV